MLVYLRCGKSYNSLLRDWFGVCRRYAVAGIAKAYKSEKGRAPACRTKSRLGMMKYTLKLLHTSCCGQDTPPFLGITSCPW